MSFRSLSEAAAEVLNASRAKAPSEPMHKEPNAKVVDIGGATLEDPQGNDVGTASADGGVPSATPPGVKPGSDTKAGMKKLDHQPGSEGSGEGRAEVSPDDLNGVGKPAGSRLSGSEPAGKGTEYAHEEVDTDEVELTEEEIAEAKEAKLAKIKAKMAKKGCKEDIDAIFSGEKLSEDFKVKATTVFEAAVVARAVMVVEEMEEEILTAAQESVDEIKAEIEEQLDSYLTVMVEEWKEENKLAIETGLKVEMMENFLSGLKSLFEENYVSIPDEEVNVVLALQGEVDELTEKLNNSMNSNIDLSKKVNEAKKQEIITSVCEGLTATQAEKIKTLAEGVEFSTEAEYKTKVSVIRESYSGTGAVKQDAVSKTVAITEQVPAASDDSKEPAKEPVSPMMAEYVRAMDRTKK